MTFKFRASTPSKLGIELALAIFACLAAICAAASADAATQACAIQETSPGGGPVVTRFLPAPLPRAREVIADAMQATGVLLFRDTEQVVEGERAVERIQVLRLPRGDEAIRAMFTAVIQDGQAGTQVRVETLRPSNKKGAPKHIWSTAVLDQAACLLSLLSLDDPLHRAKKAAADGAEIRVADSTPVPVRSRHFLFNTDLKTNKSIPFETAEDVVIDNSTAIPAGSLATASVEQSSDIGEYGRGAKAQLRFKYVVLPDGTQLPLRGIVDLQGKNENKAAFVPFVVIRVGVLSITGAGFAIPAGALFHVEVEGEQKIRVSRATVPTKDQN